MRGRIILTAIYITNQACRPLHFNRGKDRLISSQNISKGRLRFWHLGPPLSKSEIVGAISLIRNSIMLPFRHTLAILLLAICRQSLCAQQSEPPKSVLLWADGAPGALGNAPSDQPRLVLFPAPEKNRGGDHTGILGW